MKSKETVCRFPASVVEHLEPGDIQRPAEAQRRDDIIAHDDGFVGTHETVVGIEHLLDEPGAAARIAAHEREGRMRRRMVHPSPEMLWRETFDQRERFSFRGGIGWTITLHLRAGNLLGARRRVEGFIAVAARVANRGQLIPCAPAGLGVAHRRAQFRADRPCAGWHSWPPAPTASAHSAAPAFSFDGRPCLWSGVVHS